jgi:hypothetical protein
MKNAGRRRGHKEIDKDVSFDRNNVNYHYMLKLKENGLEREEEKFKLRFN